VTLGSYSPGLVLQSIGAGGGQAYLGGLASATVNIGAADGSTGDGGNILLSNTGAIATFGELSDGIVLQSIGGGGGYVITDAAPGSVTVNARSHNAGDGGRISFTQLGNIIVSGDRSRGVIAQSIGGGGGLVDGVFSGSAGGLGAGGSIDLRFEGDVVASGLGSTAIIAESLGRGAGDISIALAPGRVVLGGIGGTGVAIGGGMNNSLLNRGVLTTMSGVEGMTIAGTTGNDTVQNFGTVIGSIGLGGGLNALNNHSAGWLASGTSIDLGGGTFTNAGTIDPGARSFLTTSVNGNFVQHGTPTWLLDIGEAGHSDRLSISGRADLSNSATTIDLFGGRPVMAPGRYTLLDTAGGLSGAEFNLGTLIGEMPIGQTFSLQTSDRSLELNLQPSTGTFYWNGAVSNAWNDVFVNGRSNWTRQPDGQHIFGTPGAASDVIVDGDAVSVLGADFTIGSLSGGGLVALGGKVLTTGANGASTMWAGMLGGDGSLVKTGAGTFTLSGINPMTGLTTVAEGKLLVNGWLTGSAVHVRGGAQLGGVGVVPSVTIAGGGILSPGRSVGTLVVDGDVTFEPGSTYLVQTTSAEADLTWAAGSLFGSGATVHVQPGGDERYRPITSYGIMHAQGAGAGVFSDVVSDAAYLDPSLQYGADGVYLTLRRNDVDFRSAGTQGNQSAVAASLNGLVRTATGDMAAVINNVYDLTNGDAVQAIGSMSGVLHQHIASSALVGAQTFIDTNMTRLAHVEIGGESPVVNPAVGSVTIAPGADRQGAWFSGIGGFTRLAGREGDSPARVSDRGFAAGYDATIGHHLVVGGSAGESRPDLELEFVSDRSSSRMRHVGVYGRYAQAGSRLSVLGGVSSVANDTARLVSDGVGSSTARATYDGNSLFSRLEYGYTFSLGSNMRVEPQLGFQTARATIDGFTEAGAGVLNLVAPNRRVASQRSFLGGRAVKTFTRSNATDTRLEVRAAWAHEFNPLGGVSMRFLGDTAGNEFDLEAPARFQNGAVMGATFAGEAFRHIKFLTSVDGTFSGAVTLWTASVGIRGEW
jgi:autotransporter-associated beta strand protein